MRTSPRDATTKPSCRTLATLLSTMALVAAGACGGSVSDTGSTSSGANFLDSCSSDAGCGSLACRCGVCTRSCTASSECAELSASAVCGGGDRCGAAAGRICVEACSGAGCSVETDAGVAVDEPPPTPPTGGGFGGAGGFGGQPVTSGGGRATSGSLDGGVDASPPDSRPTVRTRDAGYTVFIDGGRPYASCPGDVTPSETGVLCGDGVLCSGTEPVCCEGQGAGDVNSDCASEAVTWSGECPAGTNQWALFCDGPEDCGPGRSCCLGVGKCQDEPCELDWTVCHSNDDCPADLPICAAHVEFSLGVAIRVCTKECGQNSDCWDLGDPADCVTRPGCALLTCEFSVY